MDPERQPLLGQNINVRCRSFRPLTYDEVLHSRQEVSWRRARLCLVLMFWAIMAMFLSMTVSLLVTAPKCNANTCEYMAPTVPPVHLTFAPLIMATAKDDMDLSPREVPEGKGVLSMSFAPQ